MLVLYVAKMNYFKHSSCESSSETPSSTPFPVLRLSALHATIL